ncbi:hypothetical protein [Flammeovirga kamogawensis]|uniref:DUF4625 domain-containing protein n=1 Tax=Flammeovirga kamogawensis TaxID=373891 RepID=A0ABX8GUQ9_9BACT|nr:hypothetical protein [Flammeovirga kamogawensis]MBB6459682.1 hypothetical protein [Flammeovirga kamogawensis]QWG07256.1 hypothetical protein KM029_18430 [Flammeovirga kamogawensis]TRX69076.1 hypothetical protein EO216_13420 [Flammeovirga kamogawensis]
MNSITKYSLSLFLGAAALFSSCSKDEEPKVELAPELKIENSKQILEVLPLEQITFDVYSKSMDNTNLSSISFLRESPVPEKFSKAPDDIKQKSYTYNFIGNAPLKKGDYEYTFTTYTEGGQTKSVKQVVRVTQEPFTLEINDDFKKSANVDDEFTVTGKVRSIRKFSSVTLSTSAVIPSVTFYGGKKYNDVSKMDPSYYPLVKSSHSTDKDGFEVLTFEVKVKVQKGHIDNKDSQKYFDVTFFAKDNSLENPIYKEDSQFKTWTKRINIK